MMQLCPSGQACVELLFLGVGLIALAASGVVAP
jgi:hypothetical protein